MRRCAKSGGWSRHSPDIACAFAHRRRGGPGGWSRHPPNIVCSSGRFAARLRFRFSCHPPDVACPQCLSLSLSVARKRSKGRGVRLLLFLPDKPIVQPQPASGYCDVRNMPSVIGIFAVTCLSRQADDVMIATLRYCSAPSRYTLTLRFIDGDDDGVIRSRSR